MPLYEYECDACGRRFERIQKFSDPPVDKCPLCEGSVRKLLSSPAIQFKGSGWYITDYAKKGGGVESGSADKAGASGDASEKSGSSSEQSEKPAEKPADKPAASSSSPKSE